MRKEAIVKAEVDKVFKANPHFIDHREKFSWLTGYLGNMDSRVMFIAENPSLRGLRRASKIKSKQNQESQWSISNGDLIFRQALANNGFKDKPPRGIGGWHCYITDIVKMADQPLGWKVKNAKERFQIVREFAPVLQKEVDLVKPKLVVVMGERAKTFFLKLQNEGRLALPPRCHVEFVTHYAEFNYHGPDSKKLERYEDSFHKAATLV